MGWQDDPVVSTPTSSGGWQNDPIVGAKSDDSSKMSGVGRFLENAFTLGGADWLTSKLPGAPSLQELQAQTEKARQDIPWYIRTPVEMGAYAVGPGKVLGAASKAATVGKLAGAVGEGVAAGGLSSGFSSDFDPSTTAMGAVGGGALGAVAHGAGKLVNAVSAKWKGGPPQFDPDAVVASTKANRDAIYGPMKKTAFDPDALMNAHTSAVLTPGMGADVTPGFKSMLSRQQEAIRNGGNTLNDIADYISNLKSVSTAQGSSNGDTLLAGKIGSNLEDLLAKGKPITGEAPGEAMDTLAKARLAHSQFKMAENLAEWQRKAAAGAPLGQAPLTEAEKFYQGRPDQYKTLVDIYQANQHAVDPTYAAAHMGSEIGGAVGYGVGGFPGHVLGKTAGYLGGKKFGKKLMGGVKNNAQVKAMQAAYPSMTGVQAPKLAQPSDKIGELIKNATLGWAY